MTRQEIKAEARKQLGGGIFKTNWIYAVLLVLIILAASGIVNVIPGVGSIVALVITGPLTYAVSYMFLKQARDNQQINFEDLARGFKDDFAGTFLIYLMTTIFTALWSLLFVIPGIIKAYSYSMAYYLKADHPEYTWKQCISESQRIMNGHKMELFIQDLSFIGWIIVGSLCLGIGTLWVDAYMNAARAQFYKNVLCAPVKETFEATAE